MPRCWPRPRPAAARIRLVDLETGGVKTVAPGRDVRPLGWHRGALLGFDGTAVRRYPGGARVLRSPGARDVVLGRDRIAAVSGGGEHSDRVVVTGLHGRRRAARRLHFVDSLAWSRDGRSLAVGWEDAGGCCAARAATASSASCSTHRRPRHAAASRSCATRTRSRCCAPARRPRDLTLPGDCDGVGAVAWAGASLAVAYTRGRTGELALLLPQRRAVATLGRGAVYGLLVSGRRAAVYQR